MSDSTISQSQEAMKHQKEAEALFDSAQSLLEQGRLFESANAFLSASRAYDLAPNNERESAGCLLYAGILSASEKEPRRQELLMVEALARIEDQEDCHDLAGQCLHNAGMCAVQRGDLATAEDRFRRALDQLRDQSDLDDIKAHSTMALADIARGREDFERAEDLYRAAATLFAHVSGFETEAVGCEVNASAMRHKRHLPQ